MPCPRTAAVPHGFGGSLPWVTCPQPVDCLVHQLWTTPAGTRTFPGSRRTHRGPAGMINTGKIRATGALPEQLALE